jgi:hypothetical protein
MNTENSNNCPSENLGTTQAKQTEIKAILHQLIQMLAIEIAAKIKGPKT